MVPLETYAKLHRKRVALPGLAPHDLGQFLLVSLASALVSCFGPMVLMRLSPNDMRPALLSLLLSLVWTIQLISAVRRYGRRRLWALVGLPLALYWPFWIAAMVVGCSLGYGCL